MKTFEEQKTFYDEQWPGLAEALSTGGAEAVAAAIREREDELERRVLFMFARQGIMNAVAAPEGFDAIITFAEAGMAEFLAQAEAAENEVERARRTDGANVLSFNLAADLAHCWPGDEAPRQTKHFERGLQAAEDCLRWRQDLGKPPGPFSMAWWAKGMHELSLGRHADSAASFDMALATGQEAAVENGESPDIDAGGSFSPLLNAGYLGLARRLNGEPGDELYDQALTAFRTQLADEKKKDDAQFGIDQLEAVAQRYLK
jgi:hypothetical protein